MNGLKVYVIKINTIPIKVVKVNNRIYVGAKWVCEGIGLSKGQMKSERKKLQSDPILINGCSKLKVQTNGGNQMVLFLEMNYLPVWLSKINAKSLNDKQYELAVSLINGCISSDFNKVRTPTRFYQWEGELRGDLYNQKSLNGYNFIDKEVTYSFGRIDILAEDKNDNLVIIELKKNKNYNDVIEQCNKYIEGFKHEFNKDIKVVICTLDEDKDFINKAKLNNFEVYKYERKLELHRVI